MSSKTLGDCNYIWAFNEKDMTGKVNCMTIETYNIEKTPEFETEATDDDGNVAAVRRGPVKYTVTASGYASANADLDCNLCKLSLPQDDEFGGGDIDGYVQKWSLSKTNNDFCKCDITVVCYDKAEYCCG